ncbi:MAG TPA: NUDIX domain-containing protein [Candidatus Saccharimonadales bacterium]|nr:NUDIX domain-containing protein [Candidatus Saccharimonadales bacterium]
MQTTEPMTPYDRRYCGAVLLDKNSKVILQVRDQKSGIVNPGKTTLFGGGQEPDESPIHCIIRELQEELNLRITPQDAQLLGFIDKREADGTITRCTLFKAVGVDANTLHVKEGRGMAIQTADDFLASSVISEVTRLSIQEVVRSKGNTGSRVQ